MAMDFFVTRPILETGLRILQESGTVDVWSDFQNESPGAEVLIRRGRESQVMLSLLTESITADILEALPDIRGIANYAVGFSNIDCETATLLGIPITNTPGVLTETTADLTWALILSIARRIPEADQFMRSGRYAIWDSRLLLGQDIGPGFNQQRKNLGIIGFGLIGQAVCRRAAGFQMRILAHDQMQRSTIESLEGVQWASLNLLLQESDFVTLHVPLTDDTRHLIGPHQLSLMKPSAFLINTSRGPVVDEKALRDALLRKDIAGAGLDVYEHEPRMTEGLADLSNTVLLPHIGSATQDTRNEMARLAAMNAVALFNGERAPNTVNPEVYETNAYKKRVHGSR